MKVNRQSLSLFLENPFEFVDNLNITIKGNNLNIFQKYQRLRNTALAVAVLFLVLWVVMGFDSTIAQILHPMYSLPQFFMGKLSWNDLVSMYHSQYGRDMHLSAFVIYGLCFYGLSKHYEKQDIVKSKNIAFAMGITLFTVGLFEFYWMGSFAYFQNQPWVLKLEMPQLRIIMQNIIFVAVGLLTLFYMYADSFIYGKETIVKVLGREFKGKEVLGRQWHFNWGLVSLFLLFCSVAFAVFWWFYPLPIEHFTVTYVDGTTWTNSNMFPQTLYTIDLNPNDGLNAGEWFWIENDLVHFVNTFVKALWTFAIFSIAKLKTLNS